MLPPLQRFNETKVSFNHCCVEQKSSKTLLPYTINELNKLDLDIRRIDSYVGFRKNILCFIKYTESMTFSIKTLYKLNYQI